VHAEIDTLQADAANWQSRALDLESERDDLQTRVARFEIERHDLLQAAQALKKQQEQFKQRAGELKRANQELQVQATRLEGENDPSRQQTAANIPVRASGASQASIVPPRIPDIVAKPNLVLFNATVSETTKRLPTDLLETNFHVYDEDREEKIEVFLPPESPSAVGLLLDNSGSMLGKRTDTVNAALAFIASSHPQDEMFIVNFNNSVWLALPSEQPFTNNHAELRAALGKTQAEGRTALYDALKLAVHHLQANSRLRTTLIVLSDGADNASSTRYDELLRLVRGSSATIHCFGIYDPDQSDKDPDVLKAIAAASGGEAYFPDTIKSLHLIWQQLAMKIREQYTIGFLSRAAVGESRYRKIRLTASDNKKNTLLVKTKSSYVPRQTPSQQEIAL